MPETVLLLVPRYDFYWAIHRGLRLGHGRMLARIGAADFADPHATRALTQGVRAHVALCRDHLEQEDRFIHADLERRAPGACARASAGHEHHGHAFDALTDLVERLETAGDAARPAAGHALYLRFAEFVAADFTHMAEEETALMPVLQAHYTDAELVEMEGRIIAATPPAIMDRVLSLMLPAISAPERAAMLAGMRGTMPVDAFDGLLRQTVLPALDQAERADLLLRLDLAA